MYVYASQLAGDRSSTTCRAVDVDGRIVTNKTRTHTHTRARARPRAPAAAAAAAAADDGDCTRHDQVAIIAS